MQMVIYLLNNCGVTKSQTQQGTGGKPKACGLNPALHLVLSGPTPCFYLAVVPSSHLTVEEQLHLYSPKNYIQPFEGNREADVAPGENELDTPAVGYYLNSDVKVLRFSKNSAQAYFVDRSLLMDMY